MPAKSKAQQKFMGMVHAAKSGEEPASKEIADAAKGMTKKAAKDYASTKHKGLPEKVKETKNSKPDFLDVDDDKNKKETFKKALADKKKAKIKETLETINQLSEMISEAKKKFKEEIYTAKMGQPPQDIDGGSAPAPKKPATTSKAPAASKKPATARKVPATKVKEGSDKQEDPPFDGPYKKKGDNKDQFGNKIKEKNVAKHLAKKGRAEAEKSASKKKEKVSESWTHDNLAAKLFETSEDHHDHEASMAKAQLMRIAEQSIELFKMIQEGDNLEGWVASKITKANDYINAVHQNLSYEAPKEKTVDSTDDYIAELRKNLERQISN
jgi:hypothetical protein